MVRSGKRYARARLRARINPTMDHRAHLAIIGSGPSCIYFLKHLIDEADALSACLGEISIFEKSPLMGVGMPYSPATTDRYNKSNISSQELPDLPVSFADWLRGQKRPLLEALAVDGGEIEDDEIYGRLALGRYLRAQYETLVLQLSKSGITVHEHPSCDIVDARDDGPDGGVSVFTAEGSRHPFDRVIIATGHRWPKEDRPDVGYFASPWPISKLLPEQGETWNFPIGTLGASLSAFDVIASLAHRHGRFVEEGGVTTYVPHTGAEDFKIVMHAGHGRLPHLQFSLEDMTRRIYRHVDRERLLELVDSHGFLRLDTYFDKVCRPALKQAFLKDGMMEMAALLADGDFGLREFVQRMSGAHDFADAFEGMRHEMSAAKESVEHAKPIHWKETIDDLVYTLNFHAERLPAEDHILLQSRVMPFVMNVIAAMPLDSGVKLLAMHDAGRLELMSGKVTITEGKAEEGMTSIVVEDGSGKQCTVRYRMFVDCSGQKALELDEYPFPSLVKDGTARKARARFREPTHAVKVVPEEKRGRLLHEDREVYYQIGGVEIDGAYRLIGSDGLPNPRIHDIAFPHTSGVRPYSYGLQSCSDTGAILVRSWIEELKQGAPVQNQPAEITQLYEKV